MCNFGNANHGHFRFMYLYEPIRRKLFRLKPPFLNVPNSPLRNAAFGEKILKLLEFHVPDFKISNLKLRYTIFPITNYRTLTFRRS